MLCHRLRVARLREQLAVNNFISVRRPLYEV
jgi:hypothetical protein